MYGLLLTNKKFIRFRPMSANIPPHQLTWLLTALYSLMEFPFAMNMIEQAELPDYQLGPVIGHGSFATVYRATDLVDYRWK